MASIPAEHLALIVGAFRVLTFWIWIPVGWLALAMIRRRLSRAGAAAPTVPLTDQEQPLATSTS
jgi:hypothetical protein